MSNARAIEAVTECLRVVIDKGIARQTSQGLPELTGLRFSFDPPAKMEPQNGILLVNLFLYRTTTDAAWANQPVPDRARPGLRTRPPLALNLYYLVNVLLPEDAPFREHHVLGRVMAAIHEHPALEGKDFAPSSDDLDLNLDAIAFVRDSRLSGQMDRVRFTPVPLPLDDLSRIFSGADARLRLSAAYEASPVLIEDTRAIHTGLPVVWRGRGEIDGFQVNPPLDFHVPELTSAAFPFPPPDAPGGDRPFRVLPGGRVAGSHKDTLVVQGLNLTGGPVSLRFRNVATKKVAKFQPAAVDITPTAVNFRFDGPETDDLDSEWRWLAGFYTVAALIDRPDPTSPNKTLTVTTNEVPFAVLPDARVLIKTNRSMTEKVLSVAVEPSVSPGQTVSLLLGGVEAPAGPITRVVDDFWIILSFFPPVGPPASTKFLVPFDADTLTPGFYQVRIRVDGVDSLLFDPADKTLTRYSASYIKRLPDGAPENVTSSGVPVR